jgi:hypothetical protein
MVGDFTLGKFGKGGSVKIGKIVDVKMGKIITAIDGYIGA